MYKKSQPLNFLATSKMNFGSTRVNPYLFQSGGRISGDYSYQGTTKIRMTDTADIELALEEARIQQAGDILNYLCFKNGQIYISKDLVVAGTIHAGGGEEDGE